MYSMTGFASRVGSARVVSGLVEWEWELRAVNGRGLDLRLRLPEGLGFMEKTLRDTLARAVGRGNVTLSLRLRISSDGASAQVDPDALQTLLAALDHVGSQAEQAGLLLQPPSALDLLGWRGVLPASPNLATIPPEDLEALLRPELDLLLADFLQMRAQEGQALAQVLADQLEQIAALVAQAKGLLEQRSAEMNAHYRKALALVMDATEADPARVAQELAILAVKSDLTEEIDRLMAHCAAGRAILAATGSVGRKLDFLTQEFNREANTLCSKAQHLEMSRIGLDLKTVIDQMREQVQNVE